MSNDYDNCKDKTKPDYMPSNQPSTDTENTSKSYMVEVSANSPSTGCSKCGQPLSGTIQGHETATWHAVCPEPSTDGIRAELDKLANSKEWLYECTAYSEGQLCCCESSNPNQARLLALFTQELNKLLEQKEIYRDHHGSEEK